MLGSLIIWPWGLFKAFPLLLSLTRLPPCYTLGRAFPCLLWYFLFLIYAVSFFSFAPHQLFMHLQPRPLVSCVGSLKKLLPYCRVPPSLPVLLFLAGLCSSSRKWALLPLDSINSEETCIVFSWSWSCAWRSIGNNSVLLSTTNEVFLLQNDALTAIVVSLSEL